MNHFVDDLSEVESQLPTRWLGHPTRLLNTVDSTNRWLKQQWTLGRARHGAAVWADAQTQGRGRLGRTWDSPPGHNIYTSMLVEPPRDRMGGVMSLMAGIALVRAVRERTGLDARIKWPNDAVIAGRKFCGILVEAGIEPAPWAIIGVGVNVEGPVDRTVTHATALTEAGAASVNRVDLWTAILTHCERAYDEWLREGDAWAAETWRGVNVTLGRTVRVERPGDAPWIGVATDIDPDGGLWVENADRRDKVISGEVHLRMADGRYAPET